MTSVRGEMFDVTRQLALAKKLATFVEE